MMQSDQQENQHAGKQGNLPKVLRVLLPLGVLAIGWIVFSILLVKPEKTKVPDGKQRSIKTRVVELQVQDFPTTIRTRGVIRPHNEVTLTPQVAGRISRILPGFEDGTFFEKDDVLLELDSQDYESSVIVAQAQLARADAAHKLEQTRANQAKLKTHTNTNQPPVIGEPYCTARVNPMGRIKAMQLRGAMSNLRRILRT